MKRITFVRVNTKTAVANAVFYLAILALLALLVVIVVKLVIWPPCSITRGNACVVDGWSIAGLAATVLGVGATVLAILGAVAVGYWWANLNQKVDTRVDEQIKKSTDQALKEQEKKLSEQTTLLLQEQTRQFEETFVKLRKEMDALGEQASLINARLQSAVKDMIIAITQQDPWIIEQWASEFMVVHPSSELAVRMVRRYLQVVDGFFPSDPNVIVAIREYQQSLKNRLAPSTDLMYYWDMALSWQQVVKDQRELTYIETASQEVEKRRNKTEIWQKKQTNLGSKIVR